MHMVCSVVVTAQVMAVGCVVSTAVLLNMLVLVMVPSGLYGGLGEGFQAVGIVAHSEDTSPSARWTTWISRTVKLNVRHCIAQKCMYWCVHQSSSLSVC